VTEAVVAIADAGIARLSLYKALFGFPTFVYTLQVPNKRWRVLVNWRRV